MAKPDFWKLWNDEVRGELARSSLSERGVAIWNAYKKHGPIGFVGGPWNGKIVPIADWPAALDVPKERPPIVSVWEAEHIWPRDDYARYLLARINSPFGGISYCYTFEDEAGNKASGWLPEIPADAIDRVLERLVYISTRAIKSAGYGKHRRAFELTFGNEIATGMMRDGKKSQLREPWQ